MATPLGKANNLDTSRQTIEKWRWLSLCRRSTEPRSWVCSTWSSCGAHWRVFSSLAELQCLSLRDAWKKRICNCGPDWIMWSVFHHEEEGKRALTTATLVLNFISIKQLGISKGNYELHLVGLVFLLDKPAWEQALWWWNTGEYFIGQHGKHRGERHLACFPASPEHPDKNLHGSGFTGRDDRDVVCPALPPNRMPGAK